MKMKTKVKMKAIKAIRVNKKTQKNKNHKSNNPKVK